MKTGQSMIYKGCLIVKKSSNNFYIDMECHGERTAISLNHAKSIINTFKK